MKDIAYYKRSRYIKIVFSHKENLGNIFDSSKFFHDFSKCMSNHVTNNLVKMN